MKTAHDPFAHLHRAITRDVGHLAYGEAELRPCAQVRVQHGAVVELQVGIPVQHEDLAGIQLHAGQTDRAAGAERLVLRRVAQGEAAIRISKMRPDRFVTVAYGEDGGVKTRSDERIENKFQEWTALYRRHRLRDVIDDPPQAGAETARQDDRLHHDVLGNSCASMIWQSA